MKRIVICCDGTWNDRARAATNVARLAQAVTPSAAEPHGQVVQIVHYDAGVGTDASVWDKAFGGATGKGLSANIKQAYRFVIDNYELGDELYFLGFSRGAYTVRSLAGLVRKCGILRKVDSGFVEDAYGIYRLPKERDPAKEAVTGVDGTLATAFRQAHAVNDRPIRIHFIGVWDTVGALGIPLARKNWLTYWANRRYRFHDVDLSTHVHHAYQALAIDEKRRAFAPTIWRKQEKAPPDQVVEQRWFPGCHSDVGGGNGNAALSDAALLWMIEKARGAGLTFDDNHLVASLHPRSAPIRESNTGLFSFLPADVRKPGQWVDPDLGRPEPEAVSTQTISRAALLQRREIEGYRPPELEKYLTQYPSTAAGAAEDFPGQPRPAAL